MGTIQTELIEKGLKHARVQEIEKENSKRCNKEKEHLSRREIEDLMGINRLAMKKEAERLDNYRGVIK